MTPFLTSEDWDRIEAWSKARRGADSNADLTIPVSLPLTANCMALLEESRAVIPQNFNIEQIPLIPDVVRPREGEIEFVLFRINPSSFAEFETARERRGLSQDIGALIQFNMSEPRYCRHYSTADVWQDKDGIYHSISFGPSGHTGFGYGAWIGEDVDPRFQPDYFEGQVFGCGIRLPDKGSTSLA